MGAEGYLLKNIRDLATARAFMERLDDFRQKLAWHGLTPESNPSAGNRFRGLYNITLKSLGAVHKKAPRTRLDHIIGYAEPSHAPGFALMYGPGNDLEGVAGQIGSGCNLVLFVTGNGSITNHPFVPTVKVMTNTPRFALPARIYANEGVAQMLFFESDEVCETSYRDRGGKYQGQTGVTLPKI